MGSQRIEIHSLGDSALSVRVPGDLDAVLRAANVLRRAAVLGVVEITTSYESVALYYDAARVRDADARPGNIEQHLRAQISDLLTSALPRADRAQTTKPVVVIPVCYQPEFALDLQDVAERAGLTTGAVIEHHCGPEYRVACIGFTPGFPYLAGLASELATPRRSVPRKAVPAGSVAIGGSQTGIYPFASPGGWNVIGCTPLTLFDATRASPALLTAGDRVRLRPITAEEFRTLQHEHAETGVQSRTNKSQGAGSGSPASAV